MVRAEIGFSMQIRGIDRGSCGLVRHLYGEEEF